MNAQRIVSAYRRMPSSYRRSISTSQPAGLQLILRHDADDTQPPQYQQYSTQHCADKCENACRTSIGDLLASCHFWIFRYFLTPRSRSPRSARRGGNRTPQSRLSLTAETWTRGSRTSPTRTKRSSAFFGRRSRRFFAQITRSTRRYCSFPRADQTAKARSSNSCATLLDGIAWRRSRSQILIVSSSRFSSHRHSLCSQTRTLSGLISRTRKT